MYTVHHGPVPLWLSCASHRSIRVRVQQNAVEVERHPPDGIVAVPVAGTDDTLVGAKELVSQALGLTRKVLHCAVAAKQQSFRPHNQRILKDVQACLAIELITASLRRSERVVWQPVLVAIYAYQAL